MADPRFYYLNGEYRMHECMDPKSRAFAATPSCVRDHAAVQVICEACGWRRDGHLGFARSGCGHARHVMGEVEVDG